MSDFDTEFDTEAMAAELAEPDVIEEADPDPEDVLPDDQAEEPSDDGSSAGPQVYVIDGVEYTEDGIRAAARFRQWLAADPSRQDDLVAWERGERVMVPTALDEEPAYQTWQPNASEDDEYLTEDEKRVRHLEQRLNAYEAHVARQSAQEDREVIDAGLISFRETHPEVDQEGFNAVLLTIRNKGWMSNLNGSDLSPTQRVRAVQELAEDAYRVVYFEQARSQAQAEAMSSVQKQVRQRRRAASAGGTSPSVSRAEPDPSQMNERERFDAMTRELAAHMAQQ